MIKKIVLAVVALVAIVGIYYLTVGSKQIVTEMKKEVNKEVLTLKKSGFNIENREVKTNKEHLVIDFNNTKEITAYLNQKGQEITKEDIELLKGLKVGLDIEYNPTAKNAMALDIYPVKLPDIFYTNIDVKDKKVVDTIEKMVKNRDLLVHININKFLSGFDGYVKDIDKELKLKGVRFNGDIKGEKIKNLNQTIKEISYNIPNQLKFELLNSKIFISNPIDRDFNNNTKYSIDKISIKGEGNDTASIVINSITGTSTDATEGKIVNSTLKLNIALIDYLIDGEKSIFKNISSDIEIKNMNIEAFKELNAILSKDLDEKESLDKMIPIFEKIVSSNISIDIPNISIEKITQNDKMVDGFKLKALTTVDKNFDFKQIKNNPLAINSLFNAKVNIEASSELVNLLSTNPRAMVLMMVLQPIDKNGKKYYNIEFSKGSLKINGRAFM